MKGDFSRLRFEPAKQYDAVLQQQGRVALDSDSNEATAIALDRDRRTTADIVGPSGAPMAAPGFGISLEAGGKLGIGLGTLYVDGLRIVNQAKFLHDAQPNLPSGAPVFVAPDGTLSAAPADGRYVAYVDVWHRHVTALEDASLQEEALGVDTTTRLQLVPQVRFLRAAESGDAVINCDAAVAAWSSLTAAPDGTLAARGKPGDSAANPCAFPETAGYQRLENHLYRVEIHRGGTVGAGATFKWSRDNAAFATHWLESNGGTFTVADTGRDALSGLKPGQWVELTDDDHELTGTPGTLVRVLTVIGTRITIDTATADGPIAIAAFGRNPKLRSWDSPGAVELTVPIANDGFLALESGLEVAFAAGKQYRSGDFWLIPARSGSGVDWPTPGGVPLAETPFGIRHSYARLAILDCIGGIWTLIGDCRPVFPPLTAMRQIMMLGGDGQEALPDPTQPALLCPLAQPLRVGVFCGTAPVAGARVRFQVVSGNGKLDPVLPTGGAASAIKPTDANGEATAPWALDAATPTQQVRAELLDAKGIAIGLPITFGASLSTAARTAFDPATAPSLAGIVTVQRAIEELSKRAGGGCVEVTLSPGTDWAKILADLPKGQDATICFRQGEFIAEAPVQVAGLGDVVIHGNGAATRIIGKKGETVIEIKDCASLDLRDLSILAAEDLLERIQGRNGALNVIGCANVTLEGLTVGCGAALGDDRTCIRVRAASRAGTLVPVERVRISHCRLTAGFGQGGVLITDALDSVVNDNSLTVLPLPRAITFEQLVADPDRLGLLARHLARDFKSAGDTAPTAPGGFHLGGFVVNVASSIGRKDWMTLIAANPPSRADQETPEAIQAYIKHITAGATKSATAPAFVATATKLRKLMMDNQNIELSDVALADLILGGDISVVPAPILPGDNDVVIPVGRYRIGFTSAIKQSTWEAIQKHHVADLNANTENEAEDKIDHLVKRFITDIEFRKTWSEISAWFNGLKKDLGIVGGQAIVVAGSVGDSVRISGNVAVGFAEGVHIGLSRRGDPIDAHESFQTVAVLANRLRLRLPVERMLGGAGLYIGNADRIRVNDNDLDQAGTDGKFRLFHEGIRIWGFLGDFIHISGNAIGIARVGVRVVAENSIKEDALLQWLAADNHAPRSEITVDAPTKLRLQGNTP